MQATGADQVLCTIEATQPGDDRYVAAPAVRVSFNYSKAPMKITAVTAPTSLNGAGPYTFLTSVLHTETEMNSGLSSLGHLLDVTSNSPTICRVNSNVTDDRPGGIFNKTVVTALDNGTCSLRFFFAGTTTRAATTLTWTGTSTGFVIPTSTFIELQSLQKTLPANGSTISLKAVDAGRVTINAFLRATQQKAIGTSTSIDSLLNVTSQTPTICIVEKITNNLALSTPYTGSVIKPLKAGTCTIKYAFPGNASLKQESSEFIWNSTVN